MRNKGKLVRLPPLKLQPLQSRTMVFLLNDLTRVSLVDLSALTVELWVMLLINVTNYMATHLVTSLRTRDSKVDILLSALKIQSNLIILLL